MDFDSIYKKLNSLLSVDREESENEQDRPKNKIWKFWFVMSFVSLGLLLVVFKLFSLQVLNANQMQEKAKRQHESKIKLSAERGDIFDRNGKLLATTIRANSIAIDPSKIEKTDSIVDILSREFGMDRQALLRKINRKTNSAGRTIRFVWIKRGIFPERLKSLKKLDDPGVRIINEAKRYYPYGFLAAQIIGYTNIDNVGISGIELHKNTLLEGRSGYMMVHRDARQKQRRSADLPIIPAVNGQSILLTIDIELQSIVELELKRGIKNALAESGTVIALKPQTGEVLAMASYPSFNPNNRATIKSEYTKIKALTDEYAPGSTFKLITAAAALSEGNVNENDSLKAFNGEMVFNWGTIKDDHSLGKITTFRDAVHKSSNIVMALQAAKIEDAKWYKYVRNFGFGSKTDIDFPGEISGKIKLPKDFNKSSKYYMGHGYDMTATPLQITNAYAAVANGGKLMQPFLVKEIIESGGNRQITEPIEIREVLETEICDRLTKLFVGVVEKGTGKNTRIKGFEIAGKTGTSQMLEKNGRYSKRDYVASFAGFYPANNPEIAMIVVVNKPRKSIYGGSNAAPIFKNITQRILSTKPELSQNDSIFAYEKLDTINSPDIRGIEFEDARRLLEEFELELNDDNEEGFVFFQMPKSGDKIKKESEVQFTAMKISKDAKEFNPAKYNVKSMSSRRALNILHKAGVTVKLSGQGNVRKQIWSKDKKSCTLVCR